jgi:signal transduction histidine kinase
MGTSPANSLPAVPPSPWELAAETIAVKIRWFGLVVGYALVNLGSLPAGRQLVLNAILTVGLAYTLLDTWYSYRGRIFLGRYPLSISLLEALFIGLLCYFDAGLDSHFRYFYILSLICCSIRHPSSVTYLTCALHCLSYAVLALAVAPAGSGPAPVVLMLIVLAWVTWASNALARLLKQIGDYLGRLNAALQENQAALEERIAERSRQLQEAQAHVLHQEKMAAFGLLAAGIAHEVGNPLTSISSMVQMLQRRPNDPYTQNKLSLVSGQLQRIRLCLRELIEFSRPASGARGRVSLGEVLDEALNIAKYYKRTRGRIASPVLPADLPPLAGVRDQLVQVFLNLILNAIDATRRDGRIDLAVRRCPGGVEVAVRDDGSGVSPANADRLFQPYFTTKQHGTGLGLFVTRKLVQDHGGSVAFESSPGQGTVFRVYLPVVWPAPTREGEAPAEPGDARLGRSLALPLVSPGQAEAKEAPTW